MDDSQGRRTAVERIAHLICETYFRLQRVDLVQDNRFEFVLTQDDVGDLCGLSSVHVNRSFQALRKDDLVIIENKERHHCRVG